MVRFRVFLEWDERNREQIIREIKRLQKRFADYHLGDATLKISNPRARPMHYHCYFANTVPRAEMMMDVVNASHACKDWKSYAPFHLPILRIVPSRRKYAIRPILIIRENGEVIPWKKRRRG
jgi:hypothetical protein